MEANTRSIEEGQKLAAAQARAEMLVNLYLSAATSPNVIATSSNPAARAASFDASSLTTEERLTLTNYELARRMALDNAHYQYEQGYLEESYYENGAKGLVAAYESIEEAETSSV